MKHLRYFLLAALVAMPLTACDEDEDTTTPTETPVVITGTVTGKVSVEGAGLAGVSVTLVGATSQSATTASGGTYTFANVPAGSYGVAIGDVPAGTSFTSTSKTTSITTQGQSVTVDFNGSYIRTSSIAGQVMVAGAGLPGVAVTATGPEGAKNAVTDNGGNYSFSGLRAGAYTVAISNIPAGNTFTTTSNAVTLGVGEAKIVSFFGTKPVVVDPVSASVTINAVTAGGTLFPVNPNAVAGQIDVVLNIDPGSNKLSKIELMLDNTVVGSQTLTNAVAGEGEQAAGQFQVVFSVNTAAFNATTGATTYPNKTYALSAKLGLVGATSASVTTSMNLIFANADFLAGTVVPAAKAIGGNGLAYYGGNIVATVIPVIYSGKTVASVTTTFSNVGLKGAAAQGPFVATVPALAITDAAAPFANTFSAGTAGPLLNYQSAAPGTETLTATAATYSDGTVMTVPAGGFPLTGGAAFTVDNVVPQIVGPDGIAATADDLVATLPMQVTGATWPVCCSNNWLNPNFAFTAMDASTATSATRDNSAAVTGGVGVGGVVTTYHIGAATLTNAQVGALAAATKPSDAGIAVSLLNTAYRPVIKYTDALGNATVVGLTANADNAATTVGLDEQAPQSQALAAGSAADKLVFSTVSAPVPAAMTFTATEDRAGFSAEPLRLEIKRLTATNLRWMVGVSTTAGGKINAPGGATIPICAAADPTNAAPCVPNATVVTQPAYFGTMAHLNDQGGNEVATDIERMALVDFVLPVNQNVSIPGSLVGGASTTFSVPTADFDLATGAFGFTFSAFPAGPYFPFGEQVVLGDGNMWDWTLSPSATATQSIPFVRGLEAVTGANAPVGAVAAASGIQFIATDAAGNQSTAQQNNFAAGTVPAGTSFTAAAYGPVGTFLISNTAKNLCNGTGAACAAANTKTVTPTAIATGASGTFPNAFAGGRVYFYWTVDANANGVVDGVEQIYLLGYANGSSALFTDTGAIRTYTYTSPVALTSADLLAKGVAAAANLRLFAIGVSSTGDGLLAAHNAAITVVAGS